MDYVWSHRLHRHQALILYSKIKGLGLSAELAVEVPEQQLQCKMSAHRDCGKSLRYTVAVGRQAHCTMRDKRCTAALAGSSVYELCDVAHARCLYIAEHGNEGRDCGNSERSMWRR